MPIRTKCRDKHGDITQPADTKRLSAPTRTPLPPREGSGEGRIVQTIQRRVMRAGSQSAECCADQSDYC